MTTPRSKATINPNAGQMADRNVGRIKTLRQAIEKAEARGQAERVAALRAELDRRRQEVQDFRASLDSI